MISEAAFPGDHRLQPPQPESRLSGWRPAAVSTVSLPVESRNRLHACSTYGFKTWSLFRGSEGMQRFQEERVCTCVLLTDARDKGRFLLEIVSSVPELALVLNLLIVKPFISKTGISLDKRSINMKSPYVIICLCKSMLAFASQG